MKSITPHRVRVLPIGWLRAAMLAFVGCLALLQLGSGAAVAEAWRSRHTAASAGSAVTQDIVRLDSLVRELRSVEVVVAMCAVISLMLWSFFAVVNVRLAARGRRSPLLAMAAWTLVPALIAVVTMLGDQSPIARGTKLMAAAEVALLYLPFRLLAGAAVQTGGSRFAFTGWYLASAAALVIHEVFTAPLDLFRPGHDADVRRTAVMLIANGFLIGVSTLMGLDATRSMNNAVADRAFRRNAAEDDVAARFAYAPPERVNAPTPVPMPTPRR